KLTEEVNFPKEKSVLAAEKAMRSLRYTITKETTKEDVVQIIGEYSDGRQIWIDVRPLTSKSSRIDVRVGATGDKAAAEKIMSKILRYL
ncbi:MAG TPA: DUF3568 family protein, partial [Candidatus Omnitrophota bacterium]|nr:DUF3568 family protein [Candidatus Omnitrophota bacterium]